MKRRNFLKFLGIVPATVTIPLAGSISESSRTTGPFKVGDIVKYVKTDPGTTDPGIAAISIKTYSKYIGNLGVVVDVRGGYAVEALNAPLPKHAWYSEEELQLVDAVEDRGT